MIEGVRHPVEDDHPRVTAVLVDWWDGIGGETGDRYRARLLPRLFFQHFTGTSYVLDLPGGELGAFLVGFVSQSRPTVGYIHVVGVAPRLRRTGVGAALYHRFCTDMAARGVREVHAITGIANRRSVAFHTGLGFTLQPGDTEVDGLPLHRDYDGPGLDAFTFVKHLP